MLHCQHRRRWRLALFTYHVPRLAAEYSGAPPAYAALTARRVEGQIPATRRRTDGTFDRGEVLAIGAARFGLRRREESQRPSPLKTHNPAARHRRAGRAVT